MKRIFCFLLLVALCSLCFGQTIPGNSLFKFNDLSSCFDFSLNPDFLSPVPLAFETEQNQGSTSVFSDAPQWAKDVRRGEIVFFGTLPFTVFFTRTIISIFRMGQNNWDRRYAPWPFQSAGAVSMTNNEVFWMFGIAGSASIAISLADYFIVRNKRNAVNNE